MTNILLSTLLTFMVNTIHDVKKEVPTFKVITEAMYYAKRVGKMDRESALKNKIIRIDSYNSDGELVEYTRFETDGSIYEKATITEIENKKLYKTTVNDSRGNLKFYSLKHLDEKGNVVEIKTYNTKGALTITELNKYDSNNNLLENAYQNFESNFTNNTTYKYNSNNKLIEEMFRKYPRKETEKRTYIYDEDGNPINQMLERENGQVIQFISQFDKENNLLLQRWFEDGKQIHQTSFTYVYDIYGNWITKKRSLNDELDFVWERTIEYH